MPCTENVSAEEYADFIYRYFTAAGNLAQTLGTECFDIINGDYAVIYYPLEALPDYGPLSLSYYTYSAIPKLFSLLDISGMEASGITRASRIPALDGDGRGVIIGFIDTGIDYQNSLFCNLDGSTRILGIWDQTRGNGNRIPGNYFEPLYGTQYTHEQINEALRSEDPLSIVPSTDTNGHGTFLASVAAGNASEADGFTGAAPAASIAAVKLKPAKQYLRDFYLIRDGAEAYQENDIMMGISYLYSLASQYSMPIVVCIGLGSNQGSHTGQLPLCSYLDEISLLYGSAAILAAGNETGYGTHYRGVTEAGKTEQEVELLVGAKNQGFTMELWAQDINVYRIGFVSPTGEVVMPLPTTTSDENSITFLLEQTEINVYYNISVPPVGSQLIFIRFRTPMPGIWHILVNSALDFSGIFHIWLPVHEFLDPDTYFLRPDPDTLVTAPGNAQYPITVTAYNHLTGGIDIHASRGFSRTGQVKPEISAPGVNVLGAALPPSSFTRKTGTSVAAAHAAGAAAILLRWGVLDGNNPYMNTSTIKTYLIRGANRNPELTYPNREFGYGTLDLYSSFLSLRL